MNYTYININVHYVLTPLRISVKNLKHIIKSLRLKVEVM